MLVGAPYGKAPAGSCPVPSLTDLLLPKVRKTLDTTFLVFGSYSLRSVISYALLDLRRIRHY